MQLLSASNPIKQPYTLSISVCMWLPGVINLRKEGGLPYSRFISQSNIFANCWFGVFHEKLCGLHTFNVTQTPGTIIRDQLVDFQFSGDYRSKNP